MKKILMAMIVALITFSCKKEPKINAPTNDFNPAKLIDGHISFTSRAAYENYLSSGNHNEIINSIPGIKNFVSFREGRIIANTTRQIGNCNVPDSLVNDNLTFFDMLDANGIVQIDNYLYRYDYCNDKMWVITATNDLNTNYHNNFMTGIETAGIVGAFRNYVDVLDAVAQGYTTMPDSASVSSNETFMDVTFKGDGTLLGRTIQELCYINNNEKDPKDQNVRLDGKLDYQKFAIYFHFYGKEKYQTRCLFNWCTANDGRRDWFVFFDYKYRVKGNGRPEVHQTGTAAPPQGFGENKADKTFYEGNRGLRWCDANWNVKNMWTNKLTVSRNLGSIWQTVCPGTTYNSFQYRNNYQLSCGVFYFYTHYNE